MINNMMFFFAIKWTIINNKIIPKPAYMVDYINKIKTLNEMVEQKFFKCRYIRQKVY